jgi:hypothetical protein
MLREIVVRLHTKGSVLGRQGVNEKMPVVALWNQLRTDIHSMTLAEA